MMKNDRFSSMCAWDVEKKYFKNDSRIQLLLITSVSRGTRSKTELVI